MQGPEEVLGRLHASYDDAFDVPMSCWSVEQLAAWHAGVQALRARAEALCVHAARAAELAAVASLDPRTRTLRQHVAEHGTVDPADVSRDLTLGRWLERFPDLDAAFRAGHLTRPHLQAIEKLDSTRTHAALVEAQPTLVFAGSQCRWRDFARVCNELMVYADADGSLADERVRNRRAGIKVQGDGTVTGSFRLDPITGAAVKAALEREAQRLTDIDADPAHPERTHRGYEQRMADALANLVARGALRPDGTLPSPLVHVVIGAEVLEEQILRESAAAQGAVPVDADGRLLPDDVRIDPADPRRRCELVDGTPIHPKQVVGLLGLAEIRRLVLSATGEVLDLGRSVRLFPRHLKAALLASTRGRCVEVGCDAPLAWLQADHVIPWSRGGPTAVGNGTIRCAACNKAKGTGRASPWAA
jgi:hypothetical protein